MVIKISKMVILTLLFSSGSALAQPGDALDLSLEDLLAAKVTSASRREESVIKTPAAIYVISADDIARSTARNVPDLLRMVPGIHVANTDSNKFSITARGFNSVYANKLLVLIDGRAVYTPVFSGVYWSQDMVPVEEIDRIEVIRGPGAAMWGSNAVNGIISIITKSSNETTGGLLRAGGGSPHTVGAYVRAGGALSDNTSGRFWSRTSRYASGNDADGTQANDDYRNSGGGARIDSTLSDSTSLSTSLIGYREDRNSLGRVLADDFSGFNMLETADHGEALSAITSVSHKSSEDSLWRGSLSFDRVVRNDLGISTAFTAFEGNLQGDFSLSPHLRFLSGIGARGIHDTLGDGNTIGGTFDSDQRDLTIFSFFAQGEYELIPNNLTLTLGSKLEDHSFTGLNVQPNMRVSWSPSENQQLWGAVSIANRTPSRFEVDGNIRGVGAGIDPLSGLPVRLNIRANQDVDNERVTTSEVGYRGLLSESLSLDTVAFYSNYDNLTGYGSPLTTLDSLNGSPFISQSFATENIYRGRTYGVETAVVWKPTNRLQLRGSYAFLDFSTELDRESPNAFTRDIKGKDPEHIASVMTSFDLTESLSSTLFLSYVDQLSAIDVPSYVRADLRLSYRVSDALKLNIVGQNLLEESHLEYGSDFFVQRTAVPRGVFGWLEYKF